MRESYSSKVSLINTTILSIFYERRLSMKKIGKSLSMLLMTCVIAFSPLTSTAAQAACSHSWTPYTFNDMWLEDSPTFGECYVRVTETIRTCTKCGDVQLKHVRKQLSHNFGSNGECLNGCGAGIARLLTP